MQQVTADNKPSVSLILSSFAAALLLFTSLTVLLLYCTSRRFRDALDRWLKRGSSRARSGVTNEGFQIDFDQPQLSSDGDAVVFSPAARG